MKGYPNGICLLMLALFLAACAAPRAGPPSPSLTPIPAAGLPATSPPAPTAPPPTPSPRPTVTLAAPPMGTPVLEATPSGAPSPAPAASPPPPPVSPSPPPLPPTAAPQPTPPAGPVAVWEGTVTLTAYDWERALVPTSPDDPAYPYHRLDFGAVGGPAPRSFRALFLQNDYVSLTVLPDLGGRILRWTDRTTGRQLFYANPVLKPTRWGYRGWWLATGGMEWAFPTEEHGLVEYLPWEYRLLGDGVHLRRMEERTGLVVEVTVRLERGSSRVLISPRITNPTGREQSFQFWANAMLTLSDFNAPSGDLRFVLPAREVIVHSTGDGSLPGPGGVMAWPVHNGRDFSRYGEWRSYLGVFAPGAADAGFAGAYDVGTDQGIVRVAPASIRGVKLFCLGDLPADLWTDDGSRYFELWGGLTPTFWHFFTLAPGRSVSWTESWYAVSGMGGLTHASAEAAARLSPTGEGVEVAVETVRPMRVSVVLRQGGQEVARWDAETGPGRPFRATFGPGGGPWALEVYGPQGLLLTAKE